MCQIDRDRTPNNINPVHSIANAIDSGAQHADAPPYGLSAHRYSHHRDETKDLAALAVMVRKVVACRADHQILAPQRQ